MPQVATLQQVRQSFMTAAFWSFLFSVVAMGVIHYPLSLGQYLFRGLFCLLIALMVYLALLQRETMIRQAKTLQCFYGPSNCCPRLYGAVVVSQIAALVNIVVVIYWSAAILTWGLPGMIWIMPGLILSALTIIGLGAIFALDYVRHRP